MIIEPELRPDLETGHCRYKNDNVDLVAVLAECEYSMEALIDQVDMTIDFNDYFLEKFFEKLSDKYSRIGCLVKIEVDEESKGKGLGNKLMNCFERDISSKTEIDILFARVKNKQKKGFNLKKFYEKRGFEAVKFSEENLLMVNKGQANLLKKELGLEKRVNMDNEVSFK